jgi:DNA-binding MarR family transcriptional regulator
LVYLEIAESLSDSLHANYNSRRQTMMQKHDWQLGQELYRLLNRAQHEARKYLDALFYAQLGVTSIQLAALLYIADHPNCLLGDLSDGLSLNNPAITGLIGRIEKKSLIHKQRSPQDGRATLVSLTAAGEQLVANSADLVAQTSARVAAGFSEAELAIVMRYFETLITRFSADSPTF